MIVVGNKVEFCESLTFHRAYHRRKVPERKRFNRRDSYPAENPPSFERVFVGEVILL